LGEPEHCRGIQEVLGPREFAENDRARIGACRAAALYGGRVHSSGKRWTGRT